jgi:hypothetical protein
LDGVSVKLSWQANNAAGANGGAKFAHTASVGYSSILLESNMYVEVQFVVRAAVPPSGEVRVTFPEMEAFTQDTLHHVKTVPLEGLSGGVKVISPSSGNVVRLKVTNGISAGCVVRFLLANVKADAKSVVCFPDQPDEKPEQVPTRVTGSLAQQVEEKEEPGEASSNISSQASVFIIQTTSASGECLESALSDRSTEVHAVLYRQVILAFRHSKRLFCFGFDAGC